MKKISIIIIIVGFIFPLSIESQVSITGQIGFTAYEGDLNSRGNKILPALDELGLSVGLGSRFAISEYLGIRAEATLIRLIGDDTDINKQHTKRGWKFDNQFIEVTTLIDYEILGNRKYASSGKFKRIITPVIFAGIGVNFNSPEVDWKKVENDNIEFDRMQNKKVTIALPVGLGLKFYMNEYFSLSAEFGLRLPVSDYYDGISKSAGAKKNDGYAFFGGKFFFNLGSL